MKGKKEGRKNEDKERSGEREKRKGSEGSKEEKRKKGTFAR